MSLSQSRSNTSSRSNILSLSSNDQQDYGKVKSESYIRLISKLKGILNRKLKQESKFQTNDPDELCDRIQTFILGRQTPTHTKEEILSLIKDFQDIKGLNRRVKNIVEILEAKIKFSQIDSQNFDESQGTNEKANHSNQKGNNSKPGYPPLPYSPTKNQFEGSPGHPYQAQTLKKRNQFYQQKISDITNELKAIKSQLSGIWEKAPMEKNQSLSQKNQKQVSNKKSQSSQSEEQYILMPNGEWISQKAFIKQKYKILQCDESEIPQEQNQQGGTSRRIKNQDQVTKQLEQDKKILKCLKFNKPDAISENVQFAESEWTQEEIPKQQRAFNKSGNNRNITQNKLNKSAVSDRSGKTSENQNSRGKQRVLNSAFKKKNENQGKEDSLLYNSYSRNQNQDPTPIDELQIQLNLEDDQQIKVPEQMKNQDIEKLAKRNKMLKQYAIKLQSRIAFISKAKNLQQVIKAQEQHRQTGFTDKSTARNFQKKAIPTKPQGNNSCPIFQSNLFQDKVDYQKPIKYQLEVRNRDQKSDKDILNKIINNESDISIFEKSRSVQEQLKGFTQNMQKIKEDIIDQNEKQKQKSNKIVRRTTKQILFQIKNVESRQDLPQNQHNTLTQKKSLKKNENIPHCPSIHYQNHQASTIQANKISQFSTSENINSNVTVAQGLRNDGNGNKKNIHQTIHMANTSKTINQSENQPKNRNNIIQNHEIYDKNLSFMSFRDKDINSEDKSPQKYTNQKNQGKQSKGLGISSPLQFVYKPEQSIRKGYIPTRPKTPPHCMVEFQQIKRKKTPSQINNINSNYTIGEFSEQRSPNLKSQSIYQQNKLSTPKQKLRGFHSPQNQQQNAFKQSTTFSSMASIPPPTVISNRFAPNRPNQQMNTLYSMVAPYPIAQLNKQMIYSHQPLQRNLIYPNMRHHAESRDSYYRSPSPGYNPNGDSIKRSHQNNFMNVNRQSFKRNSRSKSSKGIALTSPIKNSQQPFWRQYQRRVITQNVTSYY